MIARYTRLKMGSLWSEEAKFERWLKVEMASLRALESEKVVPRGTADKIQKRAKVRVTRIEKLEKVLRHDVIAFTTSIAEQLGEESRFFHYGLTSSDVVDSAFSMALVEACARLDDELSSLEGALTEKAVTYKRLPCIGRTHGVHAEPTSFGLKFLGWLVEVRRARERVRVAKENVRFGKLSGAVGSYGAISPEVEKQALSALGLKVESVATQVIPRDRHAELFCALALVGATLERIAVELRHLQRTEVREVEEEFAKGQKGSSAMPHKKNPISAENLTGLSRLLRGYAVSAMENVALWHERDISHSSVERVIGPDAFILADYAVDRMNRLIKGLRVIKGNVAANLGRTQGIYFSGHVLLRLVEKGLTRERAYKLVQKRAHAAWEKNAWFGDELWKEPGIRSRFSRKELERILDVRNYLRHVDAIYSRVFEKEKARANER